VTRRFGLCTAAAALLLAASAPAEPGAANRLEIPTGEGRFVFRDPEGNPDRPIVVHTYRPASFTPDSPLLFAMHGMSRNAVSARAAWIDYADRRGILVLAPEFSKKHYPHGAMYNRGNMTGLFGRLPEAEWTYTAIERIFDAVRRATGSRRARYLIFGHSAGGQFVHRLVLFKPQARIELAFAANAGWYAMPTFEVSYPYGLGHSVATTETLTKAFGQPLVLLLGDRDTDPNAANLNNSHGARKQGPHRFARGQAFYTTASEEARRLGVALQWRVQTVPGVGHSSSGTSRAAQELLEHHFQRQGASTLEVKGAAGFTPSRS